MSQQLFFRHLKHATETTLVCVVCVLYYWSRRIPSHIANNEPTVISVTLWSWNFWNKFRDSHVLCALHYRSCGIHSHKSQNNEPTVFWVTLKHATETNLMCVACVLPMDCHHMSIHVQMVEYKASLHHLWVRHWQDIRHLCVVIELWLCVDHTDIVIIAWITMTVCDDSSHWMFSKK